MSKDKLRFNALLKAETFVEFQKNLPEKPVSIYCFGKTGKTGIVYILIDDMESSSIIGNGVYIFVVLFVSGHLEKIQDTTY
jgi:hypothetical protein